MYQLALLYLAALLGGYALTRIPTSTLISPGIAEFFVIVGSLVMIVFAFALLYEGVRALFRK